MTFSPYDDDKFLSSKSSSNRQPEEPVALLKPATHALFNHTLIHTDIDIQALVDRLSFVREFNGLNLLFHGVPGTGKSQYAQYVARILKMSVISVSPADILNSRLGDNERRIRKVFKAAREQNSLLLIDEADSLLYARKDADRTWEVQLVNEFIQCLDAHTSPVVCTTNNLEDLDPAVLRRFLFKVEFRPLTVAQRKTAFRTYFKAECPDYLEKLENITLADFGLVYKKATVLGYLHDIPNLMKLFYEEALSRHTFQTNQVKRRKKQS